MDLKNTPEYSSKTYPLGFIYDGQHVSSDAPGNIHYEYVGSAADWSTAGMLLTGAGVVQQVTGGGNGLPTAQSSFFHGDYPEDQINILWGINLYYNR